MTEQHPLSPTDHASPVPRLLALAYVFALAYGSLYPWRGWRSIGVSPFAYLLEPAGRHWLFSDVVINMLMYLPLAMLLTLTRFARRRPLAALSLAVLAAGSLSLLLEAAQTYLPTRVPSRLDVALNTAGGLLGGLLGLLITWATRDSPHGPWHRPDLFRPRSGLMLTILAAWIVAQAAPQRMLFETGAIVEPLLRVLRLQLDNGSLPADWGPLVAGASRWLLDWTTALTPLADYAAVLESASVATTITAIGLITTDTLARGVSRPSAVAAVLLLALAVHLLSAAWIVPGRSGAHWSSAGAQGGVLMGLVLLTLLSSATRRNRLWLAIALLTLALVSANVFSPSVYQGVQLPGLFGVRRNLDALLRAVSMAWPFVTIGALLLQLRPQRRGPSLIIGRPESRA